MVPGVLAEVTRSGLQKTGPEGSWACCAVRQRLAASGTETAMTANDPSGTALIAGASKAIGAIYADRLARRGYDLILVARNGSALDELSRQLRQETSRTVDVEVADLSQPADVPRIETILRANQDIAVLVNNAGIGAQAPLLESDADAMETMIDINVTAFTRLLYAAVPGF